MEENPCIRKNCFSTECKTYVREIGYVCVDCQKEFKQFLKKRGLSPSTDSDIRLALITFIDTYRKYLISETISVNRFFKKYTTD